ncbi:hypothetical protein GCM10009097_26070 [Pigmentiphaga daeguensis]|uniref:Uncharacterized protein n=1 Tax=Pigmentiphaga daeguensis TaxID=414049 RepID=A0ABP3LVF3_9BURK
MEEAAWESFGEAAGPAQADSRDRASAPSRARAEAAAPSIHRVSRALGLFMVPLRIDRGHRAITPTAPSWWQKHQ